MSPYTKTKAVRSVRTAFVSLLRPLNFMMQRINNPYKRYNPIDFVALVLYNTFDKKITIKNKEINYGKNSYLPEQIRSGRR